MPSKGVNFTASTVMLRPDQWATVNAFAKDRGYSSTSSALRRIIDEWVMLKSKQMRLPSGDGQLERGHDLTDEIPRGRL